METMPHPSEALHAYDLMGLRVLPYFHGQLSELHQRCIRMNGQQQEPLQEYFWARTTARAAVLLIGGIC